MCASNNGHADIVKFLLQKGADPTVRGQTNKTALELASRNNQANVVQILQQFSTAGNLAGSA